MEQNTEEEYDNAYKLARAVMSIRFYLRKSMPSSELVDLELWYLRLTTLARKLDIELPMQIPKETTAEHKKRKFYQQQIDSVEACITRQSQHIIDMYNCGKYIEIYIDNLISTKATKVDDADTDVVMLSLLKVCEKDLQLIANEKGTDISEELSKGQAWLESCKLGNSEELKQIASQLETKLAKRKQPEKRRSGKLLDSLNPGMRGGDILYCYSSKEPSSPEEHLSFCPKEFMKSELIAGYTVRLDKLRAIVT